MTEQEQAQAHQLMAELIAEAEVEWEKRWPEVQQGILEAGGGKTELAAAEEQRPQLRDAFLAGVAAGIELLIKRVGVTR